MRKDILINVNSENNKVKIDNKTLGITSENLQGKIIFKPEPFVDGVCRLYVDGKGSILMDKQEDCYTVNILSSLLTEDSLDVCFKITEPETEDGIPIFCSKIMHFRVLETIDSSSTIPEDYPSWEQVLDSMMAKVEQMESDAEDRLDEVVGQIQDLTSAYNSNATNKTNEFNTNATNKTTAFNQNYASKVTEIDGAVNSAKTELDDYTEDKKDEIDGSVDDLKSELDTYETAKEGELDSHTSTKKTELNTYTNSKKSDLDDYEETKETSLNTLAGNLTSAFNSNANSKTSDFNDNATSKTGDFNTNATSKTSAYDENASTKLGAYNTNHTTKLAEYNSNATSKVSDYNTNATEKTSEFDQNASDKTDDFDDNASAKTTAFNNNATAKIAEYDAHVSELQSQITDLETLVETELESNEVEGTEIDVSDSAEYRGPVMPGANLEQEQLSGKNLLNIPDGTYTKNNYSIVFKDGVGTPNFSTISETVSFSIEIEEFTLPAGTYTLNSFTNSAYPYISLKSDKNTIAQNGYRDNGKITFSIEQPITIDNISIYYGSTGATYGITTPQLETGNGTNSFEQYCGGQAAPNPSYEIPIKVVTGDNVVKHVGKNLLDMSNTTTSQGVTSTQNNDGSINLIGTLTNTWFNITNSVNLTKIKLTAGTYIFSFDKAFDFKIRIRFYEKNSSTEYVNYTVEAGQTTIPITLTKEYDKFFVYAFNAQQGTVLNKTIKFQLEEGSTATSYEPHRGEEFELNLGYDNLIDVMPNQSEVVNGVEISTTSDGYIKLNGTATNNINKNFLWLNNLAKYKSIPQQYIYSSHYESGTTSSNFAINLRCGQQAEDLSEQFNSTSLYINDTLRTTSLNKGNTGYVTAIQIIISAGVVFDNFVCKLQLEEGNVAHTYTKFGEQIELCKIGDYEDIPFKNVVGDENYNAELEEDAWYKKGAITKAILNGTEPGWGIQSINSYGIANFYKRFNNYNASIQNQAYINYFSPQTSLIANETKTGFYLNYSRDLFIRFDSTVASTVEAFKTWLSTHNLEFYYVHETPIYEKITNPTLISQLEALRKAKWFKGVNHFWTETENLEPNLKGTYKQSNNLRLQALEQAVVALGGV